MIVRSRPSDLLVYYGWLNAFNSDQNGWNNEKVAQDMAKYDLLVFGDGIANPSHGDFANSQIIISRIKTLKPSITIFGYVQTDLALDVFKSKVNEWNAIGAGGIFMDRAGYDFGKTRSEFNERVVYVHSCTSSKVVFANAWNTDHVLNIINDVNYPNSTFNINLRASKLISSDWVLLESFPINTVAYADGYEPALDWYVRGSKILNAKVNIAGISVINNDNANAQNLFNFGFTSAIQWDLSAFGSGDVDYGASSAKTTFFNRDDVNLEHSLTKSTTITSPSKDLNDNDVYVLYSRFIKATVDFSSGNQTSSIKLSQ